MSDAEARGLVDLAPRCEHNVDLLKYDCEVTPEGAQHRARRLRELSETEMELREALVTKMRSRFVGNTTAVEIVLRHCADTAVRELLTMPHLPNRGSGVEVWLKMHRDNHGPGTHYFHAVNRVLDDYRLHADTGTLLNEEVEEGS